LRHAVMLFVASLACLPGCGGIPLSPLTNDRRTVHLEQDASKSLTLKDDMVFYDSSHPTHGIRFPAGMYVLEAEDDEYLYLRASHPLEFKDYKKGGKVDTRRIVGGIMIGKYLFRAVPAAAYIDGEGSTRILVWKLGSDFINREGKDWTKSFS
jgi:hypothetical protein